jgi:PAS domain S-box-containing protein
MRTAELDHQTLMGRGITMLKSITKRLPSLYIDVPALRPGTVGAYALALVSVGVATVLRIALDPYVVGVQFITFAPAIIITSLISGFGAGFFCVVLSTAAADFFVLEPRWSFNVEDPANVADLLLFGPVASYCAFLIGRMRFAIEREQERRALQTSKDRLQASKDQLQASKDQLQASKDQLQASKDRLQLCLDAAHLGWWQYDPLRRTGSGDARANEIHDFDIAEDEEVALEELLKRVHPDDVGGVEAAIATALDPADPKPYAHEYRIRRRDGSVRWVENHGLAYFEGAGSERRIAGFVGTLADITERKERQEREHLLMREINHRAKNMLSVVDAIAHQTATRNPKDFIERFSERVQALSANQDLLIRNAWHGVETEDLVRAQLAPFADLIGSRIVVRGPKLRLNAASAQAIGLAVHELATNAGKYGALSTDAGHLDIAWAADGDTFTMNWTEREGPPVSAPKQRGFGTTVMKTIVERSVDGAVDLHYPPSGLTWRLTCPAANALEAEPDFRAPN